MISVAKLAACVVACAALCRGAPATAAQLLVTYTGTVFTGVDSAGIFGTPSADLAGETFIATFVYDTTLGHRVTVPGSYDYVEGGTSLSLSTPVVNATLTVGGVKVVLDPGAYSAQEVDSEPGNCCGPLVYSAADGPKMAGLTQGDSAFLEADGVLSPAIEDPIPTTAGSITGIAQFFRLGSTPGAALSTVINFKSLGDVTVSAIPEPKAWMTLIAGFGLVGGAARMTRSRRPVRTVRRLA